MAGNPREHVKNKGFWDGGSPGSAKNGETAGRMGGFPGVRKPRKVGVTTDMEFPEPAEPAKT
ncbi:MAG TPA: hypothetical protein VEU30_16645 [Thermoanaerobaculia bacterium]|nr:hypothetical protein [Thermoanaerobaculia bacterium]